MLTASKLNSLRELFSRQLAQLYDAESRQLDLLPKLARASSDEHLRALFDRHQSRTHLQCERLQRIAEHLDLPLKRSPCQAIEGLVADAMIATAATGREQVRDAALIVEAQAVEQYEIAKYGCLRQFAECLGEAESQQALDEIVREETHMNAQLCDLAKTCLLAERAEAAGSLLPDPVDPGGLRR